MCLANVPACLIFAVNLSCFVVADRDICFSISNFEFTFDSFEISDSNIIPSDCSFDFLCANIIIEVINFDFVGVNIILSDLSFGNEVGKF